MIVNGNILTDKKENSMFSFITNLFKPKPKQIKKSRLMTMTKRELEKVGRKHGIELDRRYLKDDLVEQLWTHINGKK